MKGHRCAVCAAVRDIDFAAGRKTAEQSHVIGGAFPAVERKCVKEIFPENCFIFHMKHLKCQCIDLDHLAALIEQNDPVRDGLNDAVSLGTDQLDGTVFFQNAQLFFDTAGGTHNHAKSVRVYIRGFSGGVDAAAHTAILVKDGCTGAGIVFVWTQIMFFAPDLNRLLQAQTGSDGIGSHEGFLAVGADHEHRLLLDIFLCIGIADQIQNIAVLVTVFDEKALSLDNGVDLFEIGMDNFQDAQVGIDTDVKVFRVKNAGADLFVVNFCMAGSLP